MGANVAHAGAGQVGERHAVGFAATKGAVIAGVADLVIERASALTDRYGGRVVDDTFLLCFNASELDLPWQLPSAIWARPWDVAIDTSQRHPSATPFAADATVDVMHRSTLVLRSPRLDGVDG